VPKDYSFRVTGTNRSLKQKVVFTGSLLTASNVTLITQMTNRLGAAAGGAGLQTVPAEAYSQPLLNLRISGRVKIGEGKEVEINALPLLP
jgi:hypothetical protein